MSRKSDRPMAVYYEHPEWFKPLFAELERRGVPYVKLHADAHRFDPAEAEPYSLVFNRMSPSAWQRGRAHSVFYTLQYLEHLESAGVRVINGTRAYRTEISKAVQLSMLQRLGLAYPRARVINHASQAAAAAEGLRFPLVVKPNIGGSGAGVRRFEGIEELRAAAEADDLALGIDHTALVQEFIPAEQGRIVRVEVLEREFIYGIRIYSSGDSFDLCPADVCQTVDGARLDAQVCAADAPARGLRVEGYEPPPEIIQKVERITAEAGIEVGGVEYMIDERDGTPYFYDVNALSNFVADAPNVVGFDPFARLADFLIREAAAAGGDTKEAA